MSEKEEVSDSRFHMWRTLFAMAHADSVVTKEERAFMEAILAKVPFSERQRFTLETDISKPRDILQMFAGITDQADRTEFFKFAKELVWCDGDFGEDEQEMLLRLQKQHIAKIDVDALIGQIDLKLEDESGAAASNAYNDDKPRDIRGLISSFMERFRY